MLYPGKERTPLLPVVLAVIATALFLAAVVLVIRPLGKQLGFIREETALRTAAEPTKVSRSLLISIFILFFVTRLFIYLLAYWLNVANGMEGSFFGTMESIWVRSDASHYLGIARYWYRTVGDPRFHIVFFPLFPIVVAFFAPIMGYFASGMFTSNVCLFVACYFMCKLALCEGMGEKEARTSVLFLLIFPASFFCSAPFSESLFLMLSVLVLYYSRQGKFLLASIFGMLAAFTRSLGVLLAVPIFLEAISLGLEKGVRSLTPKLFFKRVWPVLLVPLGTFAYLLINYLTTGNWFQFLIYQKEHWYQTFGSFINTVHYLTANTLAWDPATAWTLGVPQLVCIFAALGLMIAGARKIRPVYSVYSLVYFFAAIAPTWLLSGPRYIMAMLPIYFVMAKLAKRRWAYALLVLLSLAGLVWMCGAFVLGYPVY